MSTLNSFRRPSPLVLKKFSIDKDGKEEGKFVEIIGRKGGLIAFLLTLMGLDNTSCFILTKNEVSYKTASLSGETNKFFPVNNIASTQCGYSKPIQYIFLAVVFFILGIILGAQPGGSFLLWIGIIVAIVFLVLYFLQKNFTISVESSGGETAELIFKRSIIEGVAVDINKTKEAILLINSFITANQTK
jgi:hypothetical protein